VHEASIACAIVEQIEERSDADASERVHAVHVRIGALSSVDPHALTFAWDLAAAGTSLAHASLVIESIPLTIACGTCACSRTVPGTVPVCPVCGTPSSQWIGGAELEIVRLEVIDAHTVS
jgi:hydrogenase nickel incorporation protein HypA/HybF